MSTQKPYGTWPSPITGDLLTQQTRAFEELTVDRGRIYWLERRPDEGRAVLVRDDGVVLSDQPGGARCEVYEYGTGATFVRDGTAYWVGQGDQCVYRAREGETPVALTKPGTWRYGALTLDATRKRLIAIAEDRSAPGEPRHSIVAIPLDGGAIVTLLSGRDFYATPVLSPDGARLAWAEWSHPHMPWDASELYEGRFDASGAIVDRRQVAGGDAGAAGCPAWSPDGLLHFSLENKGWYNLHTFDGQAVAPLVSEAAEHPGPSIRMAGIDIDDKYVLFVARSPKPRIRRLDRKTGQIENLVTGFSAVSSVRLTSDGIVFVGGSPTAPVSVWTLPDGETAPKLLRGAGGPEFDHDFIGEPELIEVPTRDGSTTFAYYFAPRAPGYEGLPGEKPPLLVNVHGGPVGATTVALQFGAGSFFAGPLYWTSRGYAYVELDYRGSTGHGKAYREALYGKWGQVEVVDAISVVDYLAERGDIDRNRVAIRGGSAGGFSVLAAVTQTETFKTGTSMFPVVDFAPFRKATHKFEARYLDSLVGDGSDDAERSPLTHVDKVRAHLLFLQGGKDKVCPPVETIRMVDALKARGRTADYVEFADEYHGFVRAPSIVESFRVEEAFNARYLLPRDA